MKRVYSRVFLSLLICCLLSAMFPFSAFAADITDSGTCGAEDDTLTWTLDSDGTLTISGVGDMEDWTDSAYPSWYDYTENIYSIVIEDGVAGIGERAFAYCDKATSVVIPDSVTTIRKNAFFGCESLTDVSIPASVVDIGMQAFTLCTGLTTLDIQNGVTSLGYCAFAECDSLTSATIPASVTYLDQHVFYDCDSLGEIQVDADNPNYCSVDGILFTKDQTELICFPAGRSETSYSIPADVTVIRGTAFGGCSNLTSVDIPEGVTDIGDWAFTYAGVTAINIPASVMHIGRSAFVTDATLCEITVDAGNTQFCSEEGVLFSADKTELLCYPANKSGADYTVPDGVTDIAISAFSDNANLTSVTIPAGITVINRNTFNECAKLETVNIPTGVIAIEYCAFYGCECLSDIVIPEGVETIGEWVFDSCTGLESISIPGSVKTVGYCAFYNCSALTSAILAEGVETIDEWAFEDCTALEHVTLPATIKALSKGVFCGCSSLKSVDIPESVEAIGEWAFEDCAALEHVTLPATIKALSKGVFCGCSSLKSVDIPESVETIGEWAFENCTALESVSIPEGVETIDYAAFYNCDSLESETIPSSVTSIGCYAFGNCDALVEIRVSADNPNYRSEDGVLFSKDGTILRCYPGGRTDASYAIPSGVTEIDEGAFYDCKNLVSVTIPEGVTIVGNSAFHGCAALSSVTIPYSVTVMEDWAFENCENLASVTIPSSVADIGKGVFDGCENLTIRCYKNSAAHDYAVENDIPFEFIRSGSGGSSAVYGLAVSDAKNGSVSVSTESARAGSTVTLTVTPDKGYTLETLTVLNAEGKEIALTPKEIGKTYTFRMPAGAVTVVSSFMEDNTMLNYFVDVKAQDYFYDAVLWAAEKGITSGVDALHFNPAGLTNRAQMVAFLWRAAGSPEPESVDCGFADVQRDAYYSKAVCWAVEKGITDGTSETAFSPDAAVTRAQAVTFLWRYEGSIPFANMTASGPAPGPFADVANQAYYSNAVLWAKARGITSGVTETAFAPEDTCTRGQVVSFLYRDLVK